MIKNVLIALAGLAAVGAGVYFYQQSKKDKEQGLHGASKDNSRGGDSVSDVVKNVQVAGVNSVYRGRNASSAASLLRCCE